MASSVTSSGTVPTDWYASSTTSAPSSCAFATIASTSAVTEAAPGASAHVDRAGNRVALGTRTRAAQPYLAAQGEAYSRLRDEARKAVTVLRDDPGCRFVSFTDITAVDYPGREKRFDVVYNLLSLKNNQRVRIKVATDESTPAIETVAISSINVKPR